MEAAIVRLDSLTLIGAALRIEALLEWRRPMVIAIGLSLRPDFLRMSATLWSEGK